MATGQESPFSSLGRSRTFSEYVEEKPKVWPGIYQEEELSPALRELNGKTPSQQVELWGNLAAKLTPNDINSTIPEPITSDFLGRYFDANHDGSAFSYEDTGAKFGQPDRVDLRGLIHVLGTHYGLVTLDLGVAAGIAENVEALKRKVGETKVSTAVGELWDLVKTEDSDGEYITKASFDYTLRRLRVGWMVSNLVEDEEDDCGHVYYYDYSESKLRGSSPNSDEMETGHTSWRSLAHGSSNRRQIPIGDDRCRYRSFAEFLFSDPRHPDRGTGSSVHWLHLQSPSSAMLLMMGQMYSIGIRIMSTLCRLGVSHSLFQHSSEWNAVTFPAVYLDTQAAVGLRKYREWTYGQNQEGTKKKDKPPEIYVSSIVRTVALAWGVEHDRPVDVVKPRTAISISGRAAYLGRFWTGPVADTYSSTRACCGLCSDIEDAEDLSDDIDNVVSQATFESAGTWHPSTSPRMAPPEMTETYPLLGQMTSRSRPSQPPEILGHAGTALTHFHPSQSAEVADAEKKTTFDSTCQTLLTHLSKPYSVIRMGNHRQLVYRMLLDLSCGYVETVKLYSAAIYVLQHHLKSPGGKGKDHLISRMTHAKLQLETLLQLLTPFVENSLPKLVKDGKHQTRAAQDEEEEHYSLSVRVCLTHLTDIEHNLKTFMSMARSQIQQCELSISQYDRDAADQGNHMLNFLTVITFVIMPIQILTGWYGMNFAHMPELKWKYGYEFCMVFGTVLSLFFCCLLGLVNLWTSK